MATAEELAVKPASEITTDNVHWDADTETYQFDDDAALKLVLDDTSTADNFMNINQWAAAWTTAAELYQSPTSQSAFDGGGTVQANVPKFMVSNHISAIIPRLMQGIFYEDVPFLIKPFPGTPQNIVEWKTAITSAQLNQMGFEDECERLLDQMALLGTCIAKWGYCEYKRKVKKYKRLNNGNVIESPMGNTVVDTKASDDFKVVFEDETISRPWLKYCDIRTVLVAPGTRVGDITQAKWVVYRDFASYADLESLRGQPGYDIPDEATLRSFFLRGPNGVQPTAGEGGTGGHDNITMTLPEGMRGWLQSAIPRNFKQSSDPLQNTLMILERWDAEKVIVVLNCGEHNILIRNEANPYGKLPFYSANWRNIQDSFYGQGLGLLIGSEQLVEQGVTNLSLDLLAYGLQPVAVRKKGFNITTQATRWRQGGIIDVDEDVDKAFKFLEMPPVPAQAWQAIAAAQAAGQATSGANEQVIQGAASAGSKATGMRSGTGAAAVVQANASRLDGPDGRFIRQIFVPWLYQLDELNADYLPASVMRDILGEQLGQAAVKEFDHIDYRSSKVKYRVLAGAHLGAKAQMNQAMPFIINLMNNPTFADNCKTAGYLFDGPAIFKAFAAAAGWDFEQPFLREMTDQEKQTEQQNSKAAIAQAQMQAQQQQGQQKFQQQQTLLNEGEMGKAANQVLRVAMEDQTKKALE